MFKKRLASLWINNNDTAVNHGSAQSTPVPAVLDSPSSKAAAPAKPSAVESNLVERDAELAKLKTYWQAAVNGQGRVMLRPGRIELSNAEHDALHKWAVCAE